MAIEIKTAQYELSHGKKPRGEGRWVFEYRHDGKKEMIFIHMTVSLREASKLVRQEVRRRGFQDLTLHVCS